MLRFNYYPVSVGDFYKDGLSGYKTTGVDNVYGLAISRIMAILDDPDRMVLSFYGKLAHGMTRKTFISGEGDTVGPFPGEYYRTMYLSPNNANNSYFLLMLRLMLITEIDNSKNGTPESLRLSYSTPRSWLEHGKKIKVTNAPTKFGLINMKINSMIDDDMINLKIDLPKRINEATQVSVRLRIPSKKQIFRILINGEEHNNFNALDETVDISGKDGFLDINVHYHN